MATYSSVLAWRIPRTEEPDRLQSMGSQRVRHDWATFTFKNYKMWSLPSKDLQSSQEYKTQANRAFIMQSHADCDIHCPHFLISFVWTFLDNLSLVLVADDHRWLYQPSFHVTSVHDAGKLKMWLPGLHCNQIWKVKWREKRLKRYDCFEVITAAGHKSSVQPPVWW